MRELARFYADSTETVVSVNGDELLLWSDFDDYGKSIVSWVRIPIADFIAKGNGPWPWYDLGDLRDGYLTVLDELGVDRPAWTQPLPADVVALFRRVSGGYSIRELLAAGADPDPVDPCGASPLWYALRALSPDNVLALIDAGADAGRRIELSARGNKFTTIVHEIVRVGSLTALRSALQRRVDPGLVDCEGATPMHSVNENFDNVNPEIVRALAAAGAAVNAATLVGVQPIELAAQRLLPGTVAALIELGAEPGRGLDALLSWWATSGVPRGEASVSLAVDVVVTLRAGGAPVSGHHRQFAADAGVSAIAAALE